MYLKKSLRCKTKKLQEITPMDLGAPFSNTYLHNCKYEGNDELPLIQSMYWLWQVKSQKPESSLQPTTNMQGKQIHMSGLDTAHWKFANTPKANFQDQ